MAAFTTCIGSFDSKISTTLETSLLLQNSPSTRHPGIHSEFYVNVGVLKSPGSDLQVPGCGLTIRSGLNHNFLLEWILSVVNRNPFGIEAGKINKTAIYKEEL